MYVWVLVGFGFVACQWVNLTNLCMTATGSSCCKIL